MFYYYNQRTGVSQWDPPAPTDGIVVNMHEHPRHRQDQSAQSRNSTRKRNRGGGKMTRHNRLKKWKKLKKRQKTKNCRRKKTTKRGKKTTKRGKKKKRKKKTRKTKI